MENNNYTKNIELRFGADEKSLSAVKRELSILSDMDLFDKEEIDGLTKELAKYKAEQAKLTQLQRNLTEVSKLGSDSAIQMAEKLKEAIAEQKKIVEGYEKIKEFHEVTKGEAFKDYFTKKYGKKSDEEKGKDYARKLDRMLTKQLDNLERIFKDSWKELQKIVSFSNLSDAYTRQLAFEFDMTGAEAYGFDKTLGVMGLRKEDIYYMDDKQWDTFTKTFENFTERFEAFEDSGMLEEMRNYQYEMAIFKEELKMSIIRFFVENKDLIKTGLNALIKLSEFTIKALDWIIKNFAGGYERTSSDVMAKSQDIISQHSISNTQSSSNTTQTINFDNNFYGVGKSDQEWMAKSLDGSYEELLKALK